MNVTLYQIIPELDNDHLMFRNLQAILQASNHQVPAELYETVFSGELEVQDLQDIFTIFNIAHPVGYRGRSMSVSDVVEIPAPTGESDFYFCEPIGYAKVLFDKNRAMLPIVNHDYKQEEKIKCGRFHIIFCGDAGISTIWCSKVILTRCRYSQCQLGYQLMYWPYGQECGREETFLSRPKVLLAYTGFRGIPESVFYEHRGDGYRKRRFSAFSDANFLAAEQWCKSQNIMYEYL